MKQHVSAYSEAISRFTHVTYRRLVTMRDKWQTLGSHYLGLIKHIGENLQVVGY